VAEITVRLDLLVGLAGGGVKAPLSYGATDRFGHPAVEGVRRACDVRATVLHLLGLDHQRLTFSHNGIERRLPDVPGAVIKPVLA